MKKHITKILSITLASTIFLTPLTAYADEGSTDQTIPTVSSSETENTVAPLVQEMIDQGYLDIDDQNNITITEKYANEITEKANEAGEQIIIQDNEIILISPSSFSRAYSGVTKVVWTFMGFDVYLDNYWSGVVSEGGNLPAAVLGLFAPPVGAVVGVIVAMHSYTIARANKNGRGVILNWKFYPSGPCLVGWSAQ